MCYDSTSASRDNDLHPAEPKPRARSLITLAVSKGVDFLSDPWQDTTDTMDKGGVGLTVKPRSPRSIATITRWGAVMIAVFQGGSVTVRPRECEDGDRLQKFFSSAWGDQIMVSGGRVHRLDECKALIAETADGQIAGVITYAVNDFACEIVSLDALHKRRGIGTHLLDVLCDTVVKDGCRKVWLVTTNDNLDAMRFYQRRGFSMTGVRLGAVEEARKIKPSIPQIGDFGIPVEHEIEFERLL